MVKAVPLQANLNNASGVGTAINDYVQDQEISDVVIGSRNLGSVRKCAAWPEALRFSVAPLLACCSIQWIGATQSCPGKGSRPSFSLALFAHAYSWTTFLFDMI